MIHKKTHFLMVLLFFSFSTITGCMEMIVLKKKSDLKEIPESLFVKKLKCEDAIVTIKNALDERHNGHIVRGWSPAASLFLYSTYTAKTYDDFYKGLMQKGEFYIQLYRNERIKECSALGIIAMADLAPFAVKKECIQTLLSYDFKSTAQDREVVFFTKFKEYAPSIIKEIYLIRYAHFALKISKELKNYIGELLFWLKFNAEESLF